MQKIYNPREAGMTIKFADGTHIEIAATAFDDFVKHDLKWAEFVHGRATVKKLACNDVPQAGSCCGEPRTQRSSVPRWRLLKHLTTDLRKPNLTADNTDFHTELTTDQRG